MEIFTLLFIHEKDEEIGCVLENEIPDSMKDAHYKVKIAVTKNDLLATLCQCHTGGDKNGCVLCVYALPVLYQLTMLLDDGMAEHVLIELHSCWSSDLEVLVKKKKKDQMKEDIETLILHYGEYRIKMNITLSKLTIRDILHHVFSMETERNENKIPRPQEVQKLCALRDVNLRSIVSKAKER